ncbi:MAG: ABC transporter permease [Anaerolineales bacterium]|nr:ABC transporter permease [Anaerolineales bacterium]
MDWIESLITAWNGLNANKMRSGLTMLGVIIGVAAVIALLSIGQGVQESNAAQLAGLDRTCSLSRLARFKWAECKLRAEALPA